MHKYLITLGAVLSLTVLTLSSSYAQSAKVVGFVDKNRDGINDLFADANGDGINDVSGRPYPHNFKFVDKNKDGVNDIWIDADGDGVNDLLAKFAAKQIRWIDINGDGIMDKQTVRLTGKSLKAHVLDVNNDGKNDITGISYTDTDLLGSRYGKVDEAAGITDPAFVDKDGDGKNDNFKTNYSTDSKWHNTTDRFIDIDGDGMADDRGLQLIKGRGKKKWKK